MDYSKYMKFYEPTWKWLVVIGVVLVAAWGIARLVEEPKSAPNRLMPAAEPK